MLFKPVQNNPLSDWVHKLKRRQLTGGLAQRRLAQAPFATQPPASGCTTLSHLQVLLYEAAAVFKESWSWPGKDSLA